MEHHKDYEMHIRRRDTKHTLCGIPRASGGIWFWTYRTEISGSWESRPTCEACLLLSLAEPDTVAIRRWTPIST